MRRDRMNEGYLSDREWKIFVTELTKGLIKKGYDKEEANDIAIVRAKNLDDSWRQRWQGDILAQVRQELRLTEGRGMRMNEMARIAIEEDDELAYDIFDGSSFKEDIYNMLLEFKDKVKIKYGSPAFDFETIETAVFKTLDDYGVKVDRSTLVHAHGIGNNNDWKIYVEEVGKKIYIGYVYITIDIYGGYFCGIRDIDTKLIPDTKCKISVYSLNNKPRIVVKNW